MNWTLTELKKSVLLISKQDRWLKTLSRSSLESSGGRPISLLFQNCWIRFLDQNFKIWESARVQTPIAIDPTANLLKVAGVTFSDSDPAPAAKFWIRVWKLLKCQIPTFVQTPVQSRQPKIAINFTLEITTKTPATAELEKRLRIRFFKKFWLRVWKKKAESCRRRLRPCGSMATSGIYPWLYLRNDHENSCYCGNWKFTSVPAFHKFSLRDRIHVRKKVQNPAGFDSGTRDERTDKFYSPSPILIRKNLIRSSPDPPI